MPLVVAAGWCGRRLCGREAWWWVPALAATATAPLVLAAAVLAVTVTLAAAAVRCSDGRHSTGRSPSYRAVATRYDKLAVRYEATVLVAAINEWL